jgi:large subunit ribosomal protein L15
MQTSIPQRKHANKKSFRVGRGIGSKIGKTSGRGMKGQKARAGHRIRPEIRDIIKKLPKLRGRGVNINKSAKVMPEVVNLALIEKHDIVEVSPKTLVEAKIVRRNGGKIPAVKILSQGEITRAINVSDCTISVAARTKIEAAGGSVK